MTLEKRPRLIEYISAKKTGNANRYEDVVWKVGGSKLSMYALGNVFPFDFHFLSHGANAKEKPAVKAEIGK